MKRIYKKILYLSGEYAFARWVFNNIFSRKMREFVFCGGVSYELELSSGLTEQEKQLMQELQNQWEDDTAIEIKGRF